MISLLLQGIVSILGIFLLFSYFKHYKRVQRWKHWYKELFHIQYMVILPFQIPFIQTLDYLNIYERFKKYVGKKPLVAYVAGHMERIVILDASLCQQIMVTKKHAFEKPHERYQAIATDLGPNILSAGDSSDIWRRHRKIAEPAFTTEHLNNVATFSVEETSQMMEYVKEKTNSFKDPIDVNTIFTKLTLSVIARAGFGMTKNLWQIEKEPVPKGHSMNLIEAANTSAGGAVLYRFFFPKIVRQLVESLPGENIGKYFARSTKDMIQYLEDIMNVKKERIEKDIIDDDLMTYFLQAKDEHGNSLSKKEILSNENIFLVAGHETTATTLSWLMYEMAKHPEMQEKICKEVEDLQGTPLLRHYIEGRLNYSKNCVKEVLRLHPPVYHIPKRARKNVKIVSDLDNQTYKIRKGHIVQISILGIHRAKMYWGEDAESFKPERMEKRILPGSYFPFSLGLRKCIGFEFAYIEATIVLASLCHAYRIKLDPTYPPNFEPATKIRVVRAPQEIRCLFVKR